MSEPKTRILTSDPVPRKEVNLPPLMYGARPEGVSSSGSDEKKVEEAQSALSGLRFT
jgi:hypothetical protein